MLNKSKKKHIFLFCVNLSGKHLVFHVKYCVGSRFFLDALYYIEQTLSSIPTLLSFYQGWMLDFVKRYFCIYSDENMVFLSLLFFFNMLVQSFILIDLSVKLNLNFWNKPLLVIMYYSFHICLDVIF